jgi:transposase
MSKQIRYTEEFKSEAITLALKSASISGTAKEQGIPSATLHTWIKTFKKNPGQGKTNSVDNQSVSVLLEENRRLVKELAQIKEEKEILKKAATYFAAHQK